ncbi:MAG TPA: hypothetical protein EYP14_14100 [Planctomycetaceae bacterium]|nr:hypothetical protein [Planctomycetaceae bacterium]
MDFEERLERAIARGQRTRDRRGQEEAERAMTEAEMRNLHSRCRLELSEHIENCLRSLVERFPGFDFKTVLHEGGWGAQVSRDDIIASSAQRRPQSFYSRLEMVIRPFTNTHIVELAAKATIRNKELFNRSYYQKLSEIDLPSFIEVIDQWVLEFAERFSAEGP